MVKLYVSLAIAIIVIILIAAFEIRRMIKVTYEFGKMIYSKDSFEIKQFIKKNYYDLSDLDIDQLNNRISYLKGIHEHE
jgi:hypothetical protein